MSEAVPLHLIFGAAAAEAALVVPAARQVGRTQLQTEEPEVVEIRLSFPERLPFTPAAVVVEALVAVAPERVEVAEAAKAQTNQTALQRKPELQTQAAAEAALVVVYLLVQPLAQQAEAGL
jgi:hypothetical protein